MDTKLGKVLNDSERLSSLKLHYPLIPWPTWSCDNFKKSYISTITRCMGSKSGKVLTYGRKFRTQTLKSSPNPCCVCMWDKKLCKCQLVFFLFFLLVDVFASTDKFFFQISPTVSLVRMTSINLHYHNAFGQKSCQSNDWPWRTPTITWPFDYEVFWDDVSN